MLQINRRFGIEYHSMSFVHAISFLPFFRLIGRFFNAIFSSIAKWDLILRIIKWLYMIHVNKNQFKENVNSYKMFFVVFLS